jgi:hypothetical protein
MNPEAVMADIRNFMKCRVVLTAAELDLFTRLGKNPAGAEDLAGHFGLNLRAATRLLDGLVVFGYLEKKEGQYQNSETGAILSADHPQTILPMVLHMNHLWDTWSRLSEIVRQGPSSRPPEIHFSEQQRKAFIGAMHVGALGLSQEIAGTYDTSAFQKLLDVGGASGSYTIAFLRKNPKLKAVIFDLKDVVPLARERLAGEGLLDRVELAAGDFYRDELPKGCDLALLSAIIHQNSLEQNFQLFSKVYKALEPGGAILIRDHIMDESRTKPPAGAVFALNMLVNTPGGDTYTLAEVQGALERAGFKEVRLLRSGGRMDCLVEGRKPV